MGVFYEVVAKVQQVVLIKLAAGLNFRLTVANKNELNICLYFFPNR